MVLTAVQAMKIVFQKARIVKSVKMYIYWRVCNNALSMLEPYEVKVSSTVLGGLGGGNIPRLPDDRSIKRRPAC
jgi:hypothetical protein